MKTPSILSLALIFLLLICLVMPADAAEEKALFFDGDNDFVDCPFIAFDKLKAFTIEVWVKNWGGYIVNQGGAGDPENGIWLSTDEGPTDGCAWESDQGKNHAINIGSLVPDQWTHIALQYDGKTQSVFLNGALVKKQEAPKPGPFDASRKLTIGATEMSRPELPWGYGSGYLKSLRISSVVRYQDRFQPAVDWTADAKTLMLYTPASVQKSRLVDLSKNGRHGDIRGARFIAADQIKPTILSGVVTDPEQRLLAGVSIELSSGIPYIKDTFLENKTNADGEYHFILNEPGKCYRLYARKDSLIGSLADIHLKPGERTLLNFTVTPSAYLKFSWAKYLAGHWLSKSMTKEGKERKLFFNCDWANNRNILKWDWTVQVADQTVEKGFGLYGWDPLRQQLRIWYWNVDAELLEGTVEVGEEKIVINAARNRAEGKKPLVHAWWFEDINTLLLQYGQMNAKGSFEPGGEIYRFTRVP